MKACVDCRFFQEASRPFNITYAKCGHPDYLDPVTGARGAHLCSSARMEPLRVLPERGIGFCGPGGKLFEPKPPRLTRRSLFEVIDDWMFPK